MEYAIYPPLILCALGNESPDTPGIDNGMRRMPLSIIQFTHRSHWTTQLIGIGRSC